MTMGDLVITYFKMGIYKVDDLLLFVSAGFITQDQSDSLINGQSQEVKRNDTETS